MGLSGRGDSGREPRGPSAASPAPRPPRPRPFVPELGGGTDLAPCESRAACESPSGPTEFPFAEVKTEREKGGDGERTLAVPSKNTYHLPQKTLPSNGCCQGAPQPRSNRNTQPRENESEHKCRCLKYVHRITIFASNYNYENGWKYIVSICMESSCGGSSGLSLARKVIP